MIPASSAWSDLKGTERRILWLPHKLTHTLADTCFQQHNTAMQIPKQLHLLKNKLCVFASIYMCACGSGFVYSVDQMSLYV